MIKLVAIAGIVAALAACKPKDKDDNTTTAALLYLLDQTSGNCAQAFKLSATSYLVSLTVVPKGGCNLATIFGSTLASYLVIQSATYDAVLTAANSLSCSAATINAITAQKNAAAATTQSAYDANVAKLQYTPISDLRIEGAIALPTTYTALGVTASDVLTWTRGTVDQLKTAQAIGLVAQVAAGAADAACATAASNKLKADFKGFIGVDSSITAKSSITSILSATCNYGSGVAANSVCATINTQF